MGETKEISLDIKPTSHTGLLLLTQNRKGDYLVLEMKLGNVSSNLVENLIITILLTNQFVNVTLVAFLLDNPVSDLFNPDCLGFYGSWNKNPKTIDPFRLSSHLPLPTLAFKKFCLAKGRTKVKHILAIFRPLCETLNRNCQPDIRKLFLLNRKQFSFVQCFIKGIRRNEFASGPS